MTPLLEQVREHYGAVVGSQLPVAIPRPKPIPPTITKSVPNFIGAVAVPPALERPSESVKTRYLVHAESSPHVFRRASLDFLAGSPKKQPTMISSDAQPSLTQMPLSNLITRPLATQQPTQKQVPRHMAKSVAAHNKQDDKAYPSLLWLIGEDRVEKESYYRVCDKSFIMLQLQKLTLAIDKVRLRLPEVQPLEASGPPSRGIMSGSPTSRRRSFASSTGSAVGRSRLSPLANPPRGTHQLL